MSDILRVLIYFDLFDHPLTERELRCFAPGHPTDQDWADTLTRLLRSYCIDELPQFFNVLRGDMTLVGPRPHMIRENLIFSQSVADYAFRFRVKPGITGLGQLRGSTRGTRRERMTDRAYWDAFYILNWSLTMDIKILFSTLAFCCGGGHKDHAILIQPLA